MSQIDGMLISLEEYTKNANQVKDLILERLEKDGILTNEQVEKYSTDWQVIIIKSNWFERWMQRFEIKKDAYKYKFVKFED